jgi:hypothetical protein
MPTTKVTKTIVVCVKNIPKNLLTLTPAGVNPMTNNATENAIIEFSAFGILPGSPKILALDSNPYNKAKVIRKGR